MDKTEKCECYLCQNAMIAAHSHNLPLFYYCGSNMTVLCYAHDRRKQWHKKVWTYSCVVFCSLCSLKRHL